MLSSYRLLLTESPLIPDAQPFEDDEGAECQFLGTVRGLEDGRQISGIEYTAYRPMADQELKRICQQALTEYDQHRVEIIHRLGFVAAKEPSILIRVKTKHSAESFDLCRWYLKQIKASVPIWKKPIWQ